MVQGGAGPAINQPTLTSFYVLARQQSVSHNFIFRFSHDYNPSAITSFSVLARKCFVTIISGSSTAVMIHSYQSILTAFIILTFNATLRFSFVPTNKLTPNFYTDGNGTRWFWEGLVQQSVSHNVMFRFSHDYNPSAITSFLRFGHECFFTSLSGANRSVNSDDIYQFDTTILRYIPINQFSRQLLF
jgi:hypothetical protein